MKGSVLQKQHATALARSPKLFLEDTPFLRYTLITKLAGVGKLLRLRGARNRLRTGGILFGVLLITKLSGVGKLLRLCGARSHFPEGSIFFLSKFS